ncbi:MAG: helix-turn-helix domain-containing protein [Bacteroides sp.]|nr:helix-turn-helix domain-containing protein [Bacteroides sp.]
MIDRKSAVLLVVNDGYSYRRVSNLLGMSEVMIRRWTGCYRIHGPSGLCYKSARHCSLRYKCSVVEDILNNHLSLHQASFKYLLSPSSIRNWLKSYEKFGKESFSKKRIRGMKKSKSCYPEPLPERSYQALLKENLRLRAENDYLKKLAALIREEEKKSTGKSR